MFCFLLFGHRIVRSRGNSTNTSSPPTTAGIEDESQNHQLALSSSPNVYTIHSLLNHSQYEYSTIKQRSSSRANHYNGKRFLFFFFFLLISLRTHYYSHCQMFFHSQRIRI